MAGLPRGWAVRPSVARVFADFVGDDALVS